METFLTRKAETVSLTLKNARGIGEKGMTVYFLPNWIPIKNKKMDTKYPSYPNRAIIK
jgi:hypothetical protein